MQEVDGNDDEDGEVDVDDGYRHDGCLLDDRN